MAADPSVLLLRTGQDECGEQGPSSYRIYLRTIGLNLTPLEAADRFKQLEIRAALRSLVPPVQRLLFACHQGDGDEARAPPTVAH
ncbi:MAG: hypothetical protein ACHQWU_14130 [Gemmatimonadales bacterium]